MMVNISRTERRAESPNVAPSVANPNVSHVTVTVPVVTRAHKFSPQAEFSRFKDSCSISNVFAPEKGQKVGHVFNSQSFYSSQQLTVNSMVMLTAGSLLQPCQQEVAITDV